MTRITAALLVAVTVVVGSAMAEERRAWEPARTRFAIGECTQWRMFPWGDTHLIKIIEIGQDHYLARSWLGPYGWSPYGDRPVPIREVDAYMQKVPCP